jgi:simple sugar transport system permease protein
MKSIPGWLVSLLIVLGIGGLIAACLAPFGETPFEGIGRLLEGSLGSARRLSESFVKTSPLLFAGLAVAVAFKTGAFNIGAEGQFLMGAIGAVLVGKELGALPALVAIPLTLLAAAIGGALWGGIAGVLKAYRNVPEVIGTIMLNFVAIHWTAALIRGPLRNPSSGLPESAEIAESAILPRLPEISEFVGRTRIHLGLAIGLGLAVLVYLLLARTVLGFKMRAVGFNPEAARFAGYRPERIWAGTLAFSGALAGLGGGVEVCAITFRVYDNFSAGYGYTAIAVALLARLHPVGVIASAFFFGALAQGAGALQRNLDVPLSMVSIVVGLVVILALALGFHRPGEDRYEEVDT